MRLAVDLGDGRLIHHRQPGVAVRVELDIEATLRLIGPHHRDRDVLGCPGLGIHDADDLRAEIGVPDLAVTIDDDIVRKRVPARQIVFRNHHLGGTPLGPGQSLERIFGSLGIAEADARQKFRGRFGRLAGHGRALAARTGK